MTAVTQQELAPVKIGHGLTHHPLHHILGQTGMLLLMLGTVAVEVLITVTEL